MKIFKKIMALGLSVMLLLSIFAVSAFAAIEPTNTGKYSEPIPLLVIKISFDADGNGKNSWTDDKKIDNVDPDSPRYGEQWCYSPDSWWYEQLFSDEEYYSLKNYYKYISNGKFWWEPVEETYGTENDGVVHVILPNVKHPNTTMGDTKSGSERGLAVKAADEYVDYSKYDKNGNGVITYDELTIAFVYGGMEASIGQGNTRQFAFNTHAHVSSAYENIPLDGVKVFNGAYLRVGESISTAEGKYLAYGTFAHELGHVLDAKDLYLSDGAKWWGSPGPLSLMGGGSKGRAGGNGYTGSSPSSLDPYYCVDYGFGDLITADSSQTEYTLYSHSTGKYNVLRINTPNPNEYYLVENRYGGEKSYDRNGLRANADTDGILVWYINELSMNNYTRPNNGGEGHDIGITVLTPEGGLSGDIDNPVYSSKTASFDNHNYKFQTTGTWSVLLTKEQMEDFHITIDFLSEPGDEMTVKVNGIYDMPVQYKVVEYDLTMTEIGLKAVISGYNNNEVVSATVKLSSNSDMSDAKTATATLLEDGSYGAKLTGLTEDTKYYYEFEIVGSKNTNVVSGVTYTNAKPVEKTNYTVSAYRNLTDNDTSPREIKVDFGEKLSYSFPMTRSGHAFLGWYLDPEFTKPFDMNFTQNEALDFSIYAKWVPNAEAATLKINGATAENKIFAVLPGEKFIEPVPAAKAGYEFEGWFADAAFTTPFDFSSPVSATGTVNVYAKWKNLNPETTPEPTQTTTAATTAPVAGNEEPANNTTTIIIIAVVAVVVLGAGAAVAVVMVKKKNK
ncbi:MAG: hypothetical protein E7608_02515 [Ruminococcaceae bacterium]|nr:hypothetical protein [Oscillospiraceae bacterium]